ncbi:hypothetical protein OROMI_033489 [Orobanche minor]
MEKAFVEAGPPVFLDQLALTVTGPIIAMVCRKWDINAITGRYLSTDFLISDGKGNTMHCTAKAKTAHTFVTKLKEGNIYTINQFAVIPNTEEYRIMKKSAYIIEFHGGTTVRKSLVKSDGFVRHPFDLIAFDDLQVTDNKHLIDVVGFITNVGRSIKQKSGSRTLDFYLTNQRGQSVRVTLWGSLGDVLIDKKTRNTGLHAIILTAVNPKLYNNKLYLSSSSSTIILDDGEIPALKAFKSETMKIHESMEIIPSENFEARDGTLENLLIWARNRKNESVTFNCHVTIDDIRTRKGWNYPSCGSDKCRKGTTRREGKFWCDSCNKPTDYPVVRYRLELDVSDDTARTVVVLFDELSYQLVKYSAQSLLKEEDEGVEDQSALPQALLNIIGTSHTFELKSHTFFEHGNYESFTCWHICEPISVGESTGSSTLSALADAGKPKMKRLIKAPTLCTPSKTSEGKRKKNIVIDDSDTEIVPAVSEVPEDDDDSEPAAKKKLKGIAIEESDTETVLDGSAELEDDEDSKPAPNKKPRRYIEECYQSE